MSRRGRVVLLFMMLAAVVFAASALATVASAGPLQGAIFTTNINGDRVNQNLFPPTQDPCLSGGPKSNSPPLPDGVYVFMVTNSSGSVLLSTDKGSCRTFRMQDHMIVEYYPCGYQNKKGVWVDCSHVTGIDVNGGITIDLKPFNPPPKNEVHKAWVTPIEHYQGSLDVVDPGFVAGHNVHGFDPSWSKTDVFKYQGKPFVPMMLNVIKWDDTNGNGVWDMGESEHTGWHVQVTDVATGVTNDYYTPVSVAVSGTCQVTEDQLPNWTQTAVSVDGQPIVPPTPSVQVVYAGTSGETHEVVFGNTQEGKISGWKWFDVNNDGVWQANEPGMPNWPMLLWNADHTVLVSKIVTDPDGFYQFNPGGGTYVVQEAHAPGWVQTYPPGLGDYTVTVPPSVTDLNFGNHACNWGTDQSIYFWAALGNGRYSLAQIQGWLDEIAAGSSWFGPMTTGDMVAMMNAALAPSSTTAVKFPAYYLVVLLNLKSGVMLDTDLAWVGWQDYLGFFSHEMLYLPEMVDEIEALGGSADPTTLADITNVVVLVSFGYFWRAF
jgi:hypothetical protein